MRIRPVVGRSHRLDDGEPQPEAAGLPAARLVRAVEAVEELGDLAGRHDRAAILHLKLGPVALRVRADRERPIGAVVAHGVLHEVPDHSLQQHAVSYDGRRLEVEFEVRAIKAGTEGDPIP